MSNHINNLESKYEGNTHLDQHVAATKLQSTFRGHLYRKKKAIEMKELDAAAVTLQGSYRRYRSRKGKTSARLNRNDAWEERGSKRVASVERQDVHHHDTRAVNEKMDWGDQAHEDLMTRSAVTVQSSFRGHAVRNHLKKEKEELTLAATKVQATYRGHSYRKKEKEKRVTVIGKFIHGDDGVSSSDESHEGR